MRMIKVNGVFRRQRQGEERHGALYCGRGKSRYLWVRVSSAKTAIYPETRAGMRRTGIMECDLICFAA